MAEENMLKHELIHGTVTVLSVFVGAWLAMRTYRSNQWWDAKRVKYEAAVKQLQKLESLAWDVWLRHSKKADSIDPDYKDALGKLKDALEELDKFTDEGSFVMSYKAYASLRKVNIKLEQLLRPDFNRILVTAPSGIVTNERERRQPNSHRILATNPVSIVEEEKEHFILISMADLHMLTWSDRLGMLSFWLYPKVFSAIFWLLSCLLVVLFGSAKGRRIADRLGDGFPLFSLPPRKAFNKPWGE